MTRPHTFIGGLWAYCVLFERISIHGMATSPIPPPDLQEQLGERGHSNI